MTGTLDSIHSYHTKPRSSTNLNRNVYIGVASGIVAASLLLTRGNLKNLPKIAWGIKETMMMCAGSALGGYMGANVTTMDNFKGRTAELKNQLIFNDFLPLIMLKGADMLCTIKDKFKRSIFLVGALLGATYFGHYLSEKINKKKYPVRVCHLAADFDDFLLPIAVATKSRGLQQFLKFISPFTFAPLGIDIGKTKNDKYAN